MDDKVYLISDDDLASMSATFSLMSTTHSQAFTFWTSFTNSSSSIRKISSSLKENFINDSMNSISQTDFVFVKSYRLVDDGILGHLVAQVAYRTNALVERENRQADVLAMSQNIQSLYDKIGM